MSVPLDPEPPDYWASNAEPDEVHTIMFNKPPPWCPCTTDTAWYHRLWIVFINPITYVLFGRFRL